MSDKPFISASKFVKLLTCQPFFIWHSLNSDLEISEDIDLNFSLPEFLDDPDNLEEFGIPFSQVQKAAFEVIKTEYFAFLKHKFKGIHALKSKSIEDKAKETKETMKSSRYILNPTFVYDYKGEKVIAIPALYDVKNKWLYFNKNSSSTKRKDLLKIIFDSLVIEKLGYEVRGISLHTFAVKSYKKGEIDFFQTSYINTTKASRTSKDAKESFDYLTLQMAKVGLAHNPKGDPFESKSLIEIFKDRKLQTVKANRKKEAEFFYFDDLDYFLDQIIEAKNITEPRYPTEHDNYYFGPNPEWNDLISLKAPEYAWYNGKVVTKQSIIDCVNIEEASDHVALEQQLSNNETIINDETVVKDLIKDINKKVVWYDFEAFSLPFCPLDEILPYNQVVSQVSSIVTDGLVEKSVTNLVVDPKNYTYDNFFSLIDAVYRKGYKYVVFNSSYENTRWKEMSLLLQKANHPDAALFDQKVQEIIVNTIDLAELFKVGSKTRLPDIMIPQLKLKHSIKLLEKHINALKEGFHYKIKEYSSLDVKNGLIAMGMANNRALNIIGDREWEAKSKMLEEYCENDVRAMLMVYNYIKFIYEK